MSTVIVTGANGFVGRPAVAALVASGHEVHGFSTRERREHDGVVWHRVDLLDAQQTTAAVDRIRADWLLHLAWYTEHGRFWSSPANLDWLSATLHLTRRFEQAGGRRVVAAGTCAEYDWSESVERCLEASRPGSQATSERPGTLYGATKQATRTVLAAFAESAGLSFAWGRIFMLYGPAEDERRLVPVVARALLSGHEAPTTDGTQVRDVMHAQDVGEAFAALIESDVEGPVNVASGDPVAVREVLSLVAAATGRGELLRIGEIPQRPGEPDRLVADVARLRDEVGFRPRMSLEDGIEATVSWWRRRLDLE